MGEEILLSPLVAPLRSTFTSLNDAVLRAQHKLDAASATLTAAQDALRVFLEDLAKICKVAGIERADVVDVPVESQSVRTPTRPKQARPVGARTDPPPFDNPISLPCNPESLRWFAGQVLYRADDDMSVDDLGAAIRAAGFRHAWTPERPKQLEASLSALPNQVTWIARGSRRGTLRIDRTALAAKRRR